jgi:hypothetical protein
MPADVMAILLGHRRVVSTTQLLARLRRAGLASDQLAGLGALVGSRVRLWTLTAAGHQLIAGSPAEPSAPAWGPIPYGEPPERWRDPGRQRDIPLLVACYRLLAAVASGLEQPVRVCAFEHPWIRTVTPIEGKRRRHVHAPAAAVLRGRQPEGGPPVALLLLPDLGTAPLSSHRPMLQALLELRRAALTSGDEANDPVLVVGVAIARSDSTARVQAWRSLLHEVARRTDEQPLRARVLECPRLLPRCRDARGKRSAGQADEVFSLVARHPLMTRYQVAALLRTSTRRIARLESDLIERGWLRPVPTNEHLLDISGPTRELRDRLQRLGLVELTNAGRREAARRLLVPSVLARRRHGLIHTPTARRRLLRHFQHTLGANTFFVDLAATAMRASSRGRDEALVEWRSAAACARGRFRPDGYGSYRRGPWLFGFFVEFDRGTERSSQYAAKLATYYRYRDSSAFKRDYASFPTVLVVTTSELAEMRFAYEAYLAQQRHGGTPLSVFLTTSARTRANPDGALGPIWRGPGTGAYIDDFGRGFWLPTVSMPVDGSRSPTALRTIVPIVV